MHTQAGRLLLSGLLGALALLAESSTMAQEEPTGAASPPASDAKPVPAPPAPVYVYPPPVYGYPPPVYGYPPPVYGYPPPVYGYPPPPAYEPPPADPTKLPGYHKHDGFYLRLQAGIGYLTTSVSYQGSTRNMSGPGVSYSAAFGGAIAPNLILYGEVLGMIVPDPSVSYGGTSTTSSGTTMALVGFGPGLAYYLEPINLYLSGTVTLSHLEVSYNNYSDDYYYSDYNPSTESYTGVGFSALVGKEWWVSTNWGLGAALQFHFASMQDDNSDVWMTSYGFALLFSSTFN